MHLRTQHPADTAVSHMLGAGHPATAGTCGETVGRRRAPRPHLCPQLSLRLAALRPEKRGTEHGGLRAWVRDEALINNINMLSNLIFCDE